MEIKEISVTIFVHDLEDCSCYSLLYYTMYNLTVFCISQYICLVKFNKTITAELISPGNYIQKSLIGILLQNVLQPVIIE